MIDPKTTGSGSSPVDFLEQRGFASLHGDPLDVIGMIVTEHMQHSMRDQKSQFVDEVSGMRGRLTSSHGGAHDDVAQQ